MIDLTPEDRRVLGLLLKEPAHELVELPLRSLRRPLEMGWAAVSRTYDTWRGNRRVEAREIRITDAGRIALSARQGGESV